MTTYDLTETALPAVTTHDQLGDGPAEDGLQDPFVLFDEWYNAATASEVNDPNAMALATVGADGLPNVRMVLLKSADPDGFVFYTNTQSRKGTELGSNMQAAAVLHWKSIRRQVRLRGPAEMVSDAEADAYFGTRARDSRIGAWASQQSRPLDSRVTLEQDVARLAARFPDDVPRPPHWTGYRIRPVYLEFWSDRPFRLHDRLVFERLKPGDPWIPARLYP
jgi:pyridoxamine 5'-phosphate oxidase